MPRKCRTCRIIRTALLSLLLGAGAGFGVLTAGGSAEQSMLATFAGAIGPVLWLARKSRAQPGDMH